MRSRSWAQTPAEPGESAESRAAADDLADVDLAEDDHSDVDVADVDLAHDLAVDVAVDVGGASHPGPRPDNQDRFRVSADLAVLSDGMGGYTGGALAADLSVAAAVRTLQGAPPAQDAARLRAAF